MDNVLIEKELKKIVKRIENVLEENGIVDNQFIDELIYESPSFINNNNDEDEDEDDLDDDNENNNYNELYDKLIKKLENIGITSRYDKKKDRIVYDRQELAEKGYKELINYLDSKKVNYEISKSTEAGYVPSIYIKNEDRETVFRIANHDNGYIDGFDMVYNDSFNTLFSDLDYINWKDNIIPKIEKETELNIK